MSKKELVVTIEPDGSIKTNATGMEGTDAEIMKELEALAAELGAEVKVEKHVHSHKGGHSHSHVHKVGGGS